MPPPLPHRPDADADDVIAAADDAITDVDVDVFAIRRYMPPMGDYDRRGDW